METIETSESEATPETQVPVAHEAPAEAVTDLFGNPEPEPTDAESDEPELSAEAVTLQRRRHQMSKDLCYDIGGMALALGAEITGLVSLPERNAATIVSDLAGVAKKLVDIGAKVKK